MSPYEPPTEDGPDPDLLRDEAWDRKPLGGHPRVFVSEDSLTLVMIWSHGLVTTATREHPDAVWGPPVTVIEEAS